MESKSCVIAEVENFIKGFHEGDYVISPDARKIEIIDTEQGGKSHTVADRLGYAIAKYQCEKDINPSGVLAIAYQLLDYIERARTHGIIIPQNLSNSLKECQEQNQRLKDNQQKLEMETMRLRVENEELHKALDKFGDRSSVAEDVQE
jgi:hypothetical protein